MMVIPTWVSNDCDDSEESFQKISISMCKHVQRFVNRGCCRLIFDLKYCISIESSVHAEHNGIRFSFVRPTTAEEKLKASTKHH